MGCGRPMGRPGLRCVLGVVAACLLVTACAEQDDAAAVRAVVEKGADLAEGHDVGGILDLATGDVVATPGDLDRRGVAAILWRAFKYYGPLRVLHPRPDVELVEGGTEASARVPFLIVRKAQDFPGLDELYDDPAAWLAAIGEQADLYRITLRLKKAEGLWRVCSAHMERFTGLGFQP